mmetsp:Transcript_59785/g.140753  ORF Transcript_59785/g.140753 Transcript_59785/m.140753 type:complete len:86 (+) Transcript_59785:639-896(+)
MVNLRGTVFSTALYHADDTFDEAVDGNVQLSLLKLALKIKYDIEHYWPHNLQRNETDDRVEEWKKLFHKRVLLEDLLNFQNRIYH